MRPRIHDHASRTDYQRDERTDESYSIVRYRSIGLLRFGHLGSASDVNLEGSRFGPDPLVAAALAMPWVKGFAS